MKLGNRFAWALMALSLFLVACGDDEKKTNTPDPDGGQAQTIAEIAAGNPDFSLLVAAATKAELVDELGDDDKLTVFAPTNDAFEASGITEETIESLSKDELEQILGYHVLAGEVKAADVEAGIVSTVADLSLVIGTTDGVTLNGGNIVTGGAEVVTTDIEASNGVIHVIDRVLLPPTVADLARYAGLTALSEALDSAELVDTLKGEGPFTVFAPTNDAFGELDEVPTGEALAAVLTYHVVAGAVVSDAVPAAAPSLSNNAYGDPLTLLFDTTDGVSINGGAAEVVIADVKGTNGIVHVVDGVLTPLNVVQAATAAGLTGVLTAVSAAADLPDDGPSVAEALAAQAPYTVFAPTNAAFADIADVIPTLSAEQIRDILLYHVLDTTDFAAPVLAADLPTEETDLKTLVGANVTFDPSTTPPTIGGADIVTTDIVVTNGVVHLIGSVMLPPS